MEVRLMFPNKSVGMWYERLAHFAARRARTMKTHDELHDEVYSTLPAKREHFLRHILEEEWSRDVAEFNIFVWDVEGAPSWLMVELLRHRFIARDWSPEQRSKRAIHGERIPVVNPFDGADFQPWQDFQDLAAMSQRFMADWHDNGIPAEQTRYAALEGSETAFCIAGNARALYDMWRLRGSTATVGDGKAHPLFQQLADTMYRQAVEVAPLLFPKAVRE